MKYHLCFDGLMSAFFVCFLISKTCDSVKYDELSVFTWGLPSALVLFCCNGPLTLAYFEILYKSVQRFWDQFNLYPHLGSASFRLKDKFHIRLWNPHAWIMCSNGNICFLASGFEHLKANYPTCIPPDCMKGTLKHFGKTHQGARVKYPPPLSFLNHKSLLNSEHFPARMRLHLTD